MKIAYVLSEGITATTDYFLFPYLETEGYTPQLLDTAKKPSVEKLSDTASIAVISRYLPYTWRKTLAELKKGGTKIVYFMDDDLFDVSALTGLPWRYRWKILRLAMAQQHYLRDVCDDFWVSTPYLAEKYAKLVPRLVKAIPPPILINRPARQLHICYHGTSSHRREISWLAEVVKQVQGRAENACFEFFGGVEVKRYYRDIRRVTVLHPMKWPEYLAWSGSMKRDIALAPLLPGAFNTGRGPTKFYDYTRLGAAGIYTDTSPYSGFIRDGIDGVLLGNEPEEWAETIITLAADDNKRRAIAEAALQRALGDDLAEDNLVYS